MDGWTDHESMMLLLAYSNYRLGKSCLAFSSFWCKSSVKPCPHWRL